jgi:MraZ protein
MMSPVEKAGTCRKTNTTKQTIHSKSNANARKKGHDYSINAMDYFERKLDDKRRLTIPTELRAEFASGVVVSRGFGEYLHLYPQIIWDREVEPALAGDNIFDEALADLNVRFRRGKISQALDQKQGRVTLEQHLLDYAGITRDIVAVRVGAYWRLGSPETLL